jgi:methylmalonyl-CoA mutase N-terminal domain/subunit
MGGMFAAVDAGFFRREIAKASFAYQQDIQKKRRLIVGVNAFVADTPDAEPPTLYIDPQLEEQQRQRLARTRAKRDALKVESSLRQLDDACRSADPIQKNIMAALVDCARANVTLGEMADVCRRVYGEYHKLAAV